MYVLLYNQTNEIVLAESLFELKEHFIHHMFKIKTDLVLDEELNKIYIEIVNRMFLAEDELEIRKCIVTANAYFKQKISVM